MKKRLLTLAMAGVMVTAAMAPVAMAADNGTATVKYVTGAGTPGGSDGSYYVVFPADLAFLDESASPTHTVKLEATSGVLGDLSDTLSVNVKVDGTGELSASGVTGKVSYQVDYTESKVLSENAKSVNLTLSKANNSKTGTGSITENNMPKVPKGTIFTDTLTFTLSETSK